MIRVHSIKFREIHELKKRAIFLHECRWIVLFLEDLRNQLHIIVTIIREAKSILFVFFYYMKIRSKCK